MFHVTWTTFKFKRNQLGTVLAYVMWLWLTARLMCTLKWLWSIEIQCHKRVDLKPKATINYTDFYHSSVKQFYFSMNTIFSIMGENMTEDWAAVGCHLTCDSWSYNEILWRVIFFKSLNGHIDYSMARRSWHTLKLFPVGSY